MRYARDMRQAREIIVAKYDIKSTNSFQSCLHFMAKIVRFTYIIVYLNFCYFFTNFRFFVQVQDNVPFSLGLIHDHHYGECIDMLNILVRFSGRLASCIWVSFEKNGKLTTVCFLSSLDRLGPSPSMQFLVGIKSIIVITTLYNLSR